MPDNDEPLYQHFNMRDWEQKGRLRLIDISYLDDMFTLEVDNDKDRPIRITLTEKPEHVTKRQSAK